MFRVFRDGAVDGLGIRFGVSLHPGVSWGVTPNRGSLDDLPQRRATDGRRFAGSNVGSGVIRIADSCRSLSIGNNRRPDKVPVIADLFGEEALYSLLLSGFISADKVGIEVGRESDGVGLRIPQFAEG